MKRRTLLVTAIAAAAVPLILGACKSAIDQGTLSIVVVDDPFVGPPPATTLDVDGIESDGGVVSLVRAQPIAQSTIDLGDQDESEEYAIRVTAFSADGGAVAVGTTLPVELGAIAGGTLDVFVERKGELARMPSPLADGRNAPLLGIVGGEYVFETGGTDTATATTTNLYDLISYAPLADTPIFATAPQSIALTVAAESSTDSYDLEALSINASGGTWLDLTADTTTAATAPTGAPTWADVAGGLSYLADDGTVYVVGATRPTGAPTGAILVVSTSQTLSWATLITPRLGAAAAWVTGEGLVVVGGSQSGTGMEILAGSQTTARSIPYPADPTTGGGLDALDATHVLMVAGSSARVFDLGCAPTATTPCVVTWPATIAPALTFAQVFDTDTQSAFVVGEDTTGLSHAFTITQASAQEIPFKISRSHARAVRTPMGPIAVVGGAAQMESFTP